MPAHLRVVDDESAPEGPYEEIDDADAAAAGQARAVAVGQEFKHIARDMLFGLGATFHDDGSGYGSYTPLGSMCGRNGQVIIVLAHGVLDDSPRAGLRRTDTIKKAGFDALQLRRQFGLPVLVVTSHLPDSGAAASQLADCGPDVLDVVATNEDFAGIRRLERYLHTTPFPGPLPAPWREPNRSVQPSLFSESSTDEEPY